jgi:hypothetical protein
VSGKTLARGHGKQMKGKQNITKRVGNCIFAGFGLQKVLFVLP